MFHHFTRNSDTKAAAQQLEEARVGQLEHAKHAEYHQAMADMFVRRIARLEAAYPQPDKAGMVPHD